MGIGKIFNIIEKETKNKHLPVVSFIKIQDNNPFKILVAGMLSARTNDKITSKVCEKLFKKINNFKSLSRLTIKEIEKNIYPVGFYKTKAVHLKKLAAMIENEFNGKIPKSIELLTRLPGVGRKTANLVMTEAFNLPAICVDIHVHRITNRIGYVKTPNPFQTEMILRETLPKKYWKKINRLFVMFGQSICRPITPKCKTCPIEKYCMKIGVKL
ncbi:MAG: endonuclease III [Candidatus Omnitrophica bacterium]|nr:endonuclease III [Candidatus Omnitrophota bacterium]MDD5081196.1 endonuclease III [Candidatus Omnitrophota bacterium]